MAASDIERDGPAGEMAEGRSLQGHAAGPRALKVGWNGVLLVCRECQKRGSGPSKLKGKQVAKAIGGAAKRAGRHPRIALTGCLGPCPKKAITVAMAGGGASEVRAWAVTSEEEAEALGRGGAALPALPALAED